MNVNIKFRPQESEKINLMRSYWLGRLSAQEMEDHELEWYCDEEEFETLKTIREDLIEDYLTNALNPEEKKAFENFFLSSEENIDKVAFFNANRKVILSGKPNSKLGTLFLPLFSNSIFGQGIKEFFTLPRIIITTAALLIMVAFVGIISRQNKNEGDLVQTNSSSPLSTSGNLIQYQPEQNDVPTNSLNNLPVGNKQKDKEPTPKLNNTSPPNILTPKVVKTPGSPRPIFITLLLAGSVRSGNSQIPTVTIPKKISDLRLVFRKPSIIDEDFKNFRVTIDSETKQENIWQQPISNLSYKKTGEDISVTLMTTKIESGTYKFSLIGEKLDGSSKILFEKSFQLKKD